ncbi:MAG: hypothetical protein HYZ28_21155 [Myxococcales bacterium]|nr:hypothetical protein [Myxococcales bacterium]
MREFRRLWRALESAAVPAGVEAEWRERLGPDLERIRSFLKPEQRLAEAFPCPSPGGDHCPRRVVVHAPDDIVAVCGNSPAECPPLRLQRRDLVVYHLDVPAWLGDVAAALRKRNILEQLDAAAGGAILPLGTLSRRGMRLPVVLMLQPVAALNEVCLGLRQKLGGDGLVVLLDQPATSFPASARVAVLDIPDNASGDLELWRALDILDPRYRERRPTDPKAIFDEVTLEFSTVPGQRHLVRINGHEFGGFQKSDLKFLRLLYLATVRAFDKDVEEGGWTKMVKLQVADDKAKGLEKLREELRKHDHPQLNEAERAALVKTSPDRNSTVRLALDPHHIVFDASLADFRFVGEQQTTTKSGERRRTPGAAVLEKNLAHSRAVSKKLVDGIRKLGLTQLPTAPRG